MSVYEFARSADQPGTVPCHSVYVEVRAAAAPDTLSRLLEPLVVMQVMANCVDAVATGDEMMTVRIDLADDIETATRLVRKLSAFVVVESVRMVDRQSSETPALTMIHA